MFQQVRTNKLFEKKFHKSVFILVIYTKFLTLRMKVAT